MHNGPKFSVVVPCYNEAEVLSLLKTRLHHCLDEIGIPWEVVFVDDGSSDGTFERMARINREDPRFKVISFSRNFGHQAAILAGLHYARGAAVGIIDADLQDPPELFGQFLVKLAQGYDVVYGIRTKRKENIPKRMAYFLFYRFLRMVSETQMPLDSGDFCVMNRRVASVLDQMPERGLFIRGLRAWAGFRQIGLEYERQSRSGGKSKYSPTALLRLAMDGLFAYTSLPLRLAVYLGLVTVAFSGVAGLFTLSWRIIGFRFMGHAASDLPGWATLACGLFLFGGMQLLVLGCIGEYVGRIYTEIKQRPRWIVREALGCTEPTSVGSETFKP